MPASRQAPHRVRRRFAASVARPRCRCGARIVCGARAENRLRLARPKRGGNASTCWFAFAM